jgi:hypothetical protein
MCDYPVATNGEVTLALLSSGLAPFPPVRRDLVEKTLLEVRPTTQLAPLPGLGKKVRRQPPPPLLPPPPPIATLPATPDNNTRGRRRHNINCLATTPCQRQGGRGVTTHATTTNANKDKGEGCSL